MRKRKTVTASMRSQVSQFSFSHVKGVLFGLLLLTTFSSGWAQCTPTASTVSGRVYEDVDYSGGFNVPEGGIAGIEVRTYDADGAQVGYSITDEGGSYELSQLEDGMIYRLEFVLPDFLRPTSPEGGDNLIIRNTQVPACEVNLGVINARVNPGGGIPPMVVSLFVKGNDIDAASTYSLYEIEGNFKSSSAKRPLVTHEDWGTVRSLAWKRSTQELFAAAFIKQYAWLKDSKHDAIYKVNLSDRAHPVVAQFAVLSELGVPIAPLQEANAEDCAYGAQTGKLGLGEIALSEDESKLYVVNISEHTLVEMSSTDPTPASTRVIDIPHPGCTGGSAYAFALELYRGKLYIGVTCTAEDSKEEQDLSIHVYKMDPATAQFEEVLSSAFPKTYWTNALDDQERIQSWLTSLAFTDEGYMILGISDRKGHRYCKSRPLINESGDILIAAPNVNGTWTLESNGRIGPYKGSGVNNRQGPGGGEFFGEDYWILGPYYHSEVSTGAVSTVAGYDNVINAVFDPLYSTFVGGLQRYNIKNGKREAGIEVYGRGEQYFGKASGIGDVEFLVEDVSHNIGDYVWFDLNMNGVQDPGEDPVEGLTLELYDANCRLVGETSTDDRGRYVFNDHNVDVDGDGIMDGLRHNADYFIRIGNGVYDNIEERFVLNNKEYKLTTPHLGQGVLAEENDSDAEVLAGCPAVDGWPGIRVSIDGRGSNSYSYDIGLIPLEVLPPPVVKKKFDLALRKMVPNIPVRPGEIVPFDIEVINQGEVSASKIEITDYLPVGLEFVSALNMGWVHSGGDLRYTAMTLLTPGESLHIPLRVKLKETATLNNIVNVAEISAAWDDKGMPAEDVDSQYDADPNNDRGGQVGQPTDDMIDDDGSIDEDDSDPALVPIMDLALIKRVDVQSPVRVDQEVVFTMDIYNQGNVPVSGYTLIDYLPEGYDFRPEKNIGWSGYGDYYQYEMVEPLLPGKGRSISLVVRISDRATPDNLINYAEVMAVRGKHGVDWSDRDFDSSPDDDPYNDVGGEPGGDTNDRIDDRGIIDEDDHDPAVVPLFDLALEKSDGNPLGNIGTDNMVEFTIRVINQGNVPATNIRIVDYLPVGLRRSVPDPSDGWIKGNDSTYYYDIAGVLLPGEAHEVTIETQYLRAYKDVPQINLAEIASATAISGNPVADFDSTPDDTPDNDPLEDGVIDRRDGTDEDDHDMGVTRAKWFDLALRKYTDSTLVHRGDTVAFFVQIINQGTIPADNINIVDYIPRGFDFLSGFGWELTDKAKVYHKVLNTLNGIVPVGGLLPGDSLEVRIDLVVRQDALPGTLVNVAEIESATSEKGGKEVDIDSNPDDDPSNDHGGEPGTGTDNLTSAPPSVDEDDSDPAFVFLAEVVSDPFCLANATTPQDGHFREEITLYGPPNQTWHIASATELYSTTSPAPPAAPVALPVGPGGIVLVEIPINSFASFYSMEAISIDDRPFSIVFENELGSRLTLNSPARHYVAPKIYGLSAACSGSLQTYHTDPIAGATYQWSLSSGGSIVGPTNQSQVQVQWSNIGGQHQLNLTVQAPGQCLEPTSYSITLGNQAAQHVNCRSFVQVSLDSSGRAIIAPQALLQGSGYDYNSFAVMLTDANGNPVAGNIATCEHIGQMLTAKVINTCTGNSCWAKVTVEDKLPPVIECFDDTMSCVIFRKYQGPRVSDNCDANPTVTILDERVEPICNDTFLKRITRTYVAKDRYGNTSAPCSQSIYLRRVNFDSLTPPPSRTNALGNPLLCQAYQVDQKGHPDPVSVGVPMYNGYPLYPDFPFYCDVSTGYVDVDLGTTGCVRKYQRIWYVFELKCDTTFVRKIYNQQIEIADTTAPTIICPDNITVTTNGGYTCEGDVWLPVPQTSDNCSETIRVTATYPGGFITDMQQPTAIKLPQGTHTIKYRVYDGCYNTDSCVFTVQVVDKTPPVAVCTALTTISLNETGTVHLYANKLDAGSYDDCAIDSMAVQRMDEGAACGVQRGFSPYVEFCCADVGDTVMVVMRVWDAEGNHNDCMVRVEVQNKIPPSITCPPCLRVPCTYKFEVDSLSKYFGRVVTDKYDVKTNTLYGANSYVLSNCDRNAPLKAKTFEDGVAKGNCGVTVSESYVDERDQCGNGYITRIFRAVNSGGQQDVCTQKIYFYDPTPFELADITWPLDYETNTCDSNFTVPANLPPRYDKPTFRNDDECALVAATYVDEVYRFIANSDACYKIIRRWTVIDWCQKDSNGVYRRWQHEQLIKVIDNVDPVITSDCSSVTTCTFDSECKGGPLELMAAAQDDCTPAADLQWEYQIDLNSDGTMDEVKTGIGGTVRFTQNYPLGQHRILWQFKDRCGNTVTCAQPFEIKNCKAPTAYCKNIIVNLNPMDMDGDGNCDTKMVDVWAKDLDDGSNHPCGYPLKYSIGKDTSVKSVRYQCGDDGIHNVEMCVTDINDNQSCCSVQIIVQDNSGMNCCPFDIPCVKFPEDSLIYDCRASLDTSFFGVPDTKECDLDSFHLIFKDTVIDAKQDPYRCQVISRVWRVELYLQGRDTFAMDTQYIIVDNLFTEDSILWPMDTVVLHGCNQSVDTTITGVATWNGDYCGEITKSFADTDISNPSDACSSVRRTWTVVNHCENDTMYTFDQILVLHNATAPVVTAPDDVTVNSGVDSCSAFVRLEVLTVGMCTDAPMIENDYNNGGADASDVYPVGMTVVTFTVTDSCGHVSTDEVRITVLDAQEPKVMCPTDTTISCDADISNLNNFGVLTAMDNCALDSVIKDSIYDLNICNVGTIRRTLRAVDTAGNVTTCEQLITIENPGAIDSTDITWPSDTVQLVACASTSPDSAGMPIVDTSGATCFKISISYMDTSYTGICNGTDTCTFIERTWTVIDSCQLGGGAGIFTRTQLIIVNNPMLRITCPPDTSITCDQTLFPLSQFGMASAFSECGIDSMYTDSVVNVNKCNVGTVMRIFTVMDTAGNSTSCTQTITIVIDSAVMESDITWPMDTVTVDSCGSTDTAHTGMAMVDTSKASCSDISISFEDTPGTFPGYCMVIVRKWTVVDSCQLDTMTMEGVWMRDQVIRVLDTVAPLITPSVLDTTIFLDPDSCQVFISGLTATATDNCEVTGITNNSPYADAGMEVADGVYPVGVTQFYFIASDNCGNVDSVQVRVEVKDTVPPTIVCHKEIQVLPDSGSITVSIGDFLWSLSDNCSDTNDIMVSFSKDDFMDTTMVYNCDSLGGRIKKIFKINMYAKDESGNIDSCVGQFELHDQDSVCFNTSLYRPIVGLIQLEGGAKMQGVKVQLSGGVAREASTDAFGQYGFGQVPIGETYTVRPRHYGSYLSGVNTRDMVAIQMHLLGKRFLSSPYQIIAADVNGSNSVSTADIVAIRNLVLGRADKYPGNTPSWKFVDAAYVFPDPSDPFLARFPQENVIPLLSHNEEANFIGVKLGDVNGDIKLNQREGKSFFRSGDGENLTLDIQPIMGDRYRFTLEVESREALSGAQFNLIFGDLGHKVAAVQFNEALNISPENVNLRALATGEIRFSWVNPGVNKADQNVATWLMSFDIVLDQGELKSFVKALDLKDDRIEAECYRRDVVHALTLMVRSEEEVRSMDKGVEFDLRPNVPNPFANTTSIPFYLSEESAIVLSVLDVNGREIYSVQGVYGAGLNEVIINAEDLPAGGIYYYKLSLNSGTAIRKMILIR